VVWRRYRCIWQRVQPGLGRCPSPVALREDYLDERFAKVIATPITTERMSEVAVKIDALRADLTKARGELAEVEALCGTSSGGDRESCRPRCRYVDDQDDRPHRRFPSSCDGRFTTTVKSGGRS
jgi:hypothetical protein